MKPTMSSEYKALLHRWYELDAVGHQRTHEQDAEKAAISAAMSAHEAAHRQQNVFEQVTTDYRDLREIGHLGGCEIL